VLLFLFFRLNIYLQFLFHLIWIYILLHYRNLYLLELRLQLFSSLYHFLLFQLRIFWLNLLLNFQFYGWVFLLYILIHLHFLYINLQLYPFLCLNKICQKISSYYSSLLNYVKSILSYILCIYKSVVWNSIIYFLLYLYKFTLHLANILPIHLRYNYLFFRNKFLIHHIGFYFLQFHVLIFQNFFYFLYIWYQSILDVLLA